MSLALRPLIREQPRLGRLVKTDRLDFDWVKERMALCDQRAVRPPFSSSITIRAIDVTRHCIVDLNDGERYVTLSYVWGDAEQLWFKREEEMSLRRPRSLFSKQHLIPRTVRDAIRLVREIGERYLWVDALCIIQDDDDDRLEQIQHMGDIYHECVLTIVACCGKDADYGLPGVQPGTRQIKQIAE
ncbi:hypothetical protein LTR22_027420, partial [Elasticomyces elasticus]